MEIIVSCYFFDKRRKNVDQHKRVWYYNYNKCIFKDVNVVFCLEPYLNDYILTILGRIVTCSFWKPSSYRAVNILHLSFKNRSVYAE